MQCYKHKATKVTMFLLAHLLLRTTMNMEFSELSAGGNSTCYSDHHCDKEYKSTDFDRF